MNVARLLIVGLVATTLAGRSAAAAEQAVSQPPGNDITPTTEPASGSPWGWLKMPSMTMPKITMPKMPADPLAPIKNSAKKVSDGGKKAWEGTKELFTGGAKSEQPATRVASAGESPSLWQRMTGSGQQEPQGPQTVGEWMSQPRTDE